MQRQQLNQGIAALALAAMLLAGGFYADKVYEPPEEPPTVVLTQNGPVILEKEAQPGDLLTAPDLKTIYYLNEQRERIVFPDPQTFESWYPDYSGVKHIARDYLESFPLSGRNATIRPGTWLVTIPSSSQVWMIGQPNHLHWLSGGEQQAVALFGEHWLERLVDLPEYYFANYVDAQPIDSTDTYPVGLLIHVKSNNQYYLVTSNGQRLVTEEGMQANHLQKRFAIEREEPVSFAQFGPPLDAYEPRWGSPDVFEQQADQGPDDIDVGDAEVGLQ